MVTKATFKYERHQWHYVHPQPTTGNIFTTRLCVKAPRYGQYSPHFTNMEFFGYCIRCFHCVRIGCRLKMVVSTFYVLFCHQKHNHVFTISIIPPHWHDTSCWNPSSCESKTWLVFIVNIMAADDLATQGAMASATMISTLLKRNNSVTVH